MERKENNTKEKIIIFIVGLLAGAIISTGAIYIYTVAEGNSQAANPGQMQTGNDPGQMNGGGGTPPEMQSNNGTGGAQSQSQSKVN